MSETFDGAFDVPAGCEGYSVRSATRFKTTLGPLSGFIYVYLFLRDKTNKQTYILFLTDL